MKRLFLLPLAALALAPTALAQPSTSPGIRPRDAASEVGALSEFAYETGALYAIEASPQRITDIALEPGESLLSVSAGDTARWIVSNAVSGTGALAQPHVLVKPVAEGLTTNLILMTDRRVYHLEARSRAGAAMTAISWRYPAALTLHTAGPQQPSAPQATLERPQADKATGLAPERLNLRYRIEGDKPDWRPLSAFDDGQRVFIEMPARLSIMEAPPLFVIGDEGPELVNYRIQANFYVVDRLFRTAELRLGGGRGQKTVRIIRQTPITADETPGGGHGR